MDLHSHLLNGIPSRGPAVRGALPTALLGGVLGLSLCAGGAGCDRKPPAMPQRPPPQVSVTRVVTKDVPVYLDEIGKATAREAVTITPQVAGTIVQRHFEDGADLTKGQLLFTIDTRPYEAAFHQTQATLAKDKATAEDATRNAERQRQLFGQNAVSAQAYDQARFTADAATAAVQADTAAAEMARINLDYCTIHSPIEGRAGLRLVDVGNVVKANEGSLLTIVGLDPIYADFTVNEHDLPAVRDNMARGTLKALVKVPTDAGEGREGELTFLDNAVQDATGTIKLRATVPNKHRHFWPNQFVNVRLVLRTEQNAVLVPGAVPQLGQKGPYVFVIKDDKTAELRPVVLGQHQGDLVVVEKGLRAGETVVSDGQMTVIPGGPVTVLPPAAPPDNSAKSQTLPASVELGEVKK
jgi:multidrug efflux system membrane fusion protein